MWLLTTLVGVIKQEGRSLMTWLDTVEKDETREENARLRQAIKANAGALRRAGLPGFPDHRRACHIIADDLDRSLER